MVIFAVTIVLTAASGAQTPPTIHGHELDESVDQFLRVEGINPRACTDDKLRKQAKLSKDTCTHILDAQQGRRAKLAGYKLVRHPAHRFTAEMLNGKLVAYRFNPGRKWKLVSKDLRDRYGRPDEAGGRGTLKLDVSEEERRCWKLSGGYVVEFTLTRIAHGRSAMVIEEPEVSFMSPDYQPQYAPRKSTLDPVPDP